jgi:hypothetical protein
MRNFKKGLRTDKRIAEARALSSCRRTFSLSLSAHFEGILEEAVGKLLSG